ncbi:MAG TPA: HmuY family protein [Candidatus Kapabacteria bacterium]|nr:HmuY family protein [Candidatus Kapabacteria bacterium]
MKFYILFVIVLAFVLSSCIKEETPVQPYPRGDLETETIEMTAKYTNQVYFSFEKGQSVSSYIYDIWDLAFKSYGEDYYIMLNGAKFMEAADMGEVAFESVTSRKDAPFRYDSTNGDYADYSIGKWWEDKDNSIISKKHVYIINRGNNTNNRKVGYVKFMVLGIENNEYKIRFANLDNSNDYVIYVPRNEGINFTHISLDDGGKIVNIEPPSQSWDLLFNKYIAILLYEEEGNIDHLPYSVTGVTINDRYVEVGADTTLDFKSITIDDIPKFKFSKRPDCIGHEWKSFTLQGESYTVRPEINYILKDKNGFYWKFHFTFFYNEKGERGYPQFDFKRL